MDHTTLLGSLQLFESLSVPELQVLSDRLEVVTVEGGEAVFLQGEPGGRMYIVEHGAVDIAYGDGRERVNLATLVPGQYFGELSLFDGSPRSASAIATKPCSLLALDRDDFVEFVQKHPTASLKVMGELAERLRQTNALFSRQVTRNVLEEEEDKITFGQRVADRVAAFGGSWPFIGIFAALMAVWMSINAVRGIQFDPYPFILLNLMLSTLAALQAPIIMMSQNRHAAKDKLLAQNDFEVNLKAEIGVQSLLKGQSELFARLALLERQLAPAQRSTRPSGAP
jgi:CRP/FNR family cyclic AMP-dependent transcriptional regulator